MNSVTALDPATALDFKQVSLRIGFALVAGLILGLERESHGRAAGLKTTILACVASCLAMILSENFYRETAGLTNVFRPDRARLAAGILTGIGFLGAGAIIRQGTLVRGVTTAAVLWFITILGLAFGSGHIFLGIVGTCIASFALFALPHMESHIKKDHYSNVSVDLGLNGISDEEIRLKLESVGVRVQRIAYEYDLKGQSRTLTAEVKMRRNDVFPLSKQVIQVLKDCPGVTRVKWG